MAPITLTGALAKVIEAEAERQELSTRQLAELAHIPKTTLYNSITGDRPLKWAEMVAVASALRTRAGTLAIRAEDLAEHDA
jgi:predicted transcriptional regulator